ncbi:MAG: hypothetical protein IKZ61_10315 [Prevotella sp.]|nr:hypothetical protein [Prevotella sp.]
MKKTLLLIIALCCTVVAGAQSTDEISAILQHGDDVSVYKGSTGLKQAHAAASDGDVITLSRGSFDPVNIEKSLTIYGAGFEDNEETNTAVTTINGNINVGKADPVIDGLHIEGVKINGNLAGTQILKNYTVQRCYITGNLTFANNIENVKVKQCRIGGNLDGSKTVVATGLHITNCYVWGEINYFSNESIVNIDHSFIGYQYNTYYDYNDYNNFAQFLWTNSIIYNRGPNYRMATGNYATVKNCIVVNGGGGIRDNNIIENCYYVDLANLFDDAEDGVYTESRTFKLKDEDTYKGTDGTPIGPYGGDGWNKVPSTPYVKNLNATVDGVSLDVDYDAGVR